MAWPVRCAKCGKASAVYSSVFEPVLEADDGSKLWGNIEFEWQMPGQSFLNECGVGLSVCPGCWETIVRDFCDKAIAVVREDASREAKE